MTYDNVREILRGRDLPCALLDLELLEQNARDVLRRAASLPVRLGTKSLRCVEVLRRVTALSDRFSGFLAYSAREAAWLASLGLDDIIVAYPTVGSGDLEAVSGEVARGKSIVLMVDDAAQLGPIASAGASRRVVLPVCIDLDMSSQFPGLYFGVRRSPVRSPEDALRLADDIGGNPWLRLDGLMGYEAQISGMQDALPRRAAKNALVRKLKERSILEINARRAQTVEALRAAGFALRFVNGGGTGSVESTVADSSVTEVTVGSALYGPTLYDGFAAFAPAPAMTFALSIARNPRRGIYTCSGGGYIASGPPGPDRAPAPYLPAGGSLLPHEGAGEVQTPVRFRKIPPLSLGDPIVFRHAKSGEICERFNTVLFVRDGAIVDEIETYRGAGQSFL